MSRFDNEIRITQSVLDRLVDEEPSMSQDPPKARSVSLAELKKSVRRDLEWLLNTRCFTENIDGGLEESLKSVAFYGLPDFTAVSVKNPNEQRRMAQALEEAIKIFEPRFSDLKVTLEPIDNVDRLLKFKIEATLDVDPAPEPVMFDTVLQLGGSSFEVQDR